MPNMSYCRFENTANDLVECRDALRDHGVTRLVEEANESEKPYITELIELCREIADQHRA
jgi:hypothetical protein